ncbi:MAG TPA: exosortase A [Allosphingosinicella sp.]|jgi:exosortase A|nr:exosortase A [Allosphingosinicella sp.]
MTAILPIEKAEADAAGQGWRTHLAGLAVVWAAILLVCRRDAADMVSIWWNSSTFNHCLLIVPLLGWLVWQRRPELSRLAPAAWAPGLLLVAAGAVAWLLGEAGMLALARHTGLILMLQGAAIACLGKTVARGLAFPLFYMLFLIPFGEEAEPFMQTLTADMAMRLLGLTGVPAHIEGVFIATPTGNFEVAEACSGVKFLVAMLAYGALAANLCFRSWTRRILFMAACVVVPALANGIRAWGTIYIAYRSGSTAFAEGMDHVIYGWFFFGAVMALIMACAWRFFDRKAGEPAFDPEVLQRAGTPAGATSRLVRIAAAAVALAAVPPLWSAAIASVGAQRAPADVALPDVPGWTRVPAHGRPWQPHFDGADLLRIGRYRNAAGQEVDLALVVYANQGEGKKLVAYGQGAAERPWAWTADTAPPRNGKGELLYSFGTVREALTFYRVGDVLTGSAAAVKLETMKVRLLGGPQRAVAVIVSAEQPADGGSIRPALDAFLRALGPVDRLADRAAGLPQRR